MADVKRSVRFLVLVRVGAAPLLARLHFDPGAAPAIPRIRRRHRREPAGRHARRARHDHYWNRVATLRGPAWGLAADRRAAIAEELLEGLPSDLETNEISQPWC
jgi:hypothetical protein